MLAPAIRQSLGLVQGALALVYPVRCLLCDERVLDDFSLCAGCFAAARFLDGLTCDLCGVPLEGEGEGEEVCDDCLTLARPWTRGRAALSYEGSGRRLVLKLKHGDRPDLARSAARWMAAAGGDCLADAVIVPVPIHWSRRIARRYNQSAELARWLSRETGQPCLPRALMRRRATPSQDHRRVTDRFANVEGAIEAAPHHGLDGKRVCLVDDVMASGATLAVAARAALDAGAADVGVLVLARVVKRP